MDSKSVVKPARVPKTFDVTEALSSIGHDALGRTAKLLYGPVGKLFALQHILQQLPGVQAGYVNLVPNNTWPNYDDFVAGPVPADIPEEEKVQADINNFLAGSISYWKWVDRARQIRHSGTRQECVGNLSVALNVGAAYAAGMTSANTVLSLIPTAGVLIGAPAKELWVLYKLCPLAGILSILLSLGGSIVPMEVNDYENIDSFQYQGMMPSAKDHVRNTRGEADGLTQAEVFANQVLHRARSPTGGRPVLGVGGGMFLQTCAIIAILLACWFLENGAILVWWCEAGYWMFVWYLGVAFSSVLENFAGVPFTKTYTIRAWRAPPVEVDDTSPWVRPPNIVDKAPIVGTTHGMDEYLMGSEAYYEQQAPLRPHLSHRPTASELQDRAMDDPVEVLTGLEKGYSSDARIWMDHSKPYSQGSDAFYVLLSVKGVSTSHAALRVFSKFISIGVFAVGTALFASATLITIMEAQITASLILCSGIFGRVTAMWMASTMMRHKPVLHRVVESREEAGRYLQAIFKHDEIACEIKGHVIVQGRCVKRLSTLLRWNNLFGVLSKPFDLSRIAVNHQSYTSQVRQSSFKDNYSVAG